ncbi:Gfo/Idh/MocA family protein [Lysobacter korlensis]|uniref:Gfo/Idh/MocA family protein n=1 Tax=Lysobacter korlensis TaxID=553636 RepID=A0ABV6RUJ4_9GAMM
MAEGIPVAVIGTGWWATTHHLPALAADSRVRLVAVCDREVDRARVVAERFGVPAWYSSVDELLAAGDVAAAVVAVSSSAHHDIVAQLLEAGAHVLVEKPIATTAADAYELVRLAQEHRRELVVGYTSQFAPAALAVRDWVRNELGELVTVSVEFTSNMVRLFDDTGDPDDPGRPHPSSYRSDTGGGQALTQLTHAVGMVAWVTGRRFEQTAAQVSARGLEVDLVDSVAFRLEGDVLGVAMSSGAIPAGLPSRQVVRYTGTAGMVEQDLKAGTARLFLPDGAERVAAPDSDQPGYPTHRPAEYLIDVVDGAANVCGEPMPAAHAAAFIAAVYRAAETGRWESVPGAGAE